MTCVSRWRAAVHAVLFTFATGMSLASYELGCSAPTTRVRMRSHLQSTPASSQASAEPAPSQNRPAVTKVVNGLTLERVADLHLTVPWDVQLGTPCKSLGETAHPNAASSVELLGDFVADGYELRVKLDAATSRAVPARQVERELVPLVQLVDAWTGVVVGRHRLAVFAARISDQRIPLDDRGKPAVAFCEFDLDSAGRLLPADGSLDTTLLGPEGTLHGAQSSQMVVQAFVVESAMNASGGAASSESPWRLLIERPDGGLDTHPIQPGAYRLSSVKGETLAGGDYTLWTLRDEPTERGEGDTAPVHRLAVPAIRHTITINPE